jgi:hypothetical protein
MNEAPLTQKMALGMATVVSGVVCAPPAATAPEMLMLMIAAESECWGVQCFTNRPLTEEELKHLQTVHDLAGHLLPALPLAAQDLDANAFGLASIHEQMGRTKSTLRLKKGHPDLLTCYTHFAEKSVSGFHRDSRSLLTPAEEWQVLGEFHNVARRPLPPRLRSEQLFEVLPPPTFCDAAGATVRLDDLVKKCEDLLVGLVDQKSAVGTTMGAEYPLRSNQDASERVSDLSEDMHKELKESWMLHQQIAKAEDLKDGQAFEATIKDYQVHFFDPTDPR